MPFDVHEFPAATRLDRRDRRQVATWLLALCGMVFVMIVLGGATRLTGSGLSIMEWAPLRGALPPLDQAEWRRLYEMYQQIPQSRLLHAGMDLDGFRRIFWLEWVHRLWGRLIGIAFVVPLAWLWVRGAIPRRLLPRLVLLLVLGGLQGAVGWFMVASGFFPDSTSVSPQRLVVHLALALVLYGALLWTALSVLRPLPVVGAPPRRLLTALARASVAVVALTMLVGGFVAGTHAGLLDNSFPLVEGRLVPPGYEFWRPFTGEAGASLASIQFDHRVLASLAAVLCVVTVAAGLRAGARGGLRLALMALLALVAVQYALGVATLVLVVPVPLAISHQATAVLVLSAAVAVAHAVRRSGASPPAADPALPVPQELP